MLGSLFERKAIPGTPPSQWSPFYGSSDWAGSTVNESTALGVPALGRGIDLIASTVAGLPIDLYRGERDALSPPDRVLPEDIPQILIDPAPPLTPWQHRYGIVSDLITWGNSIHFIASRGDDGWPLEMVPLDITAVSIFQQNVGGPVLYRAYGYEFGGDDVWHVQSGNFSGRIGGRGIVQQYGQAIGAVTAAEEYAARFYESGAVPTGVIGHPNPNLSDAGAESVKQRFLDSVGARQRKPVVLPAGASYTPIISDADKAQLTEARSWNANLCATILGIPPFLLGLKQEGLVYSNSEMLGRSFATFTLTRWTRLLEHSIDRHLLPGDFSTAFNFDMLTTPDMKMLTETLALQVSSGLRTVDEARAVMDLPPMEEPDQPLEAVPGFQPLEPMDQTEGVEDDAA